MYQAVATLVLWIVAINSLWGFDWPQFLGPTRNGVYSGLDLADSWPKGTPVRVWEKEVGEGLAGPVVAGGRVIIFHRRGDREIVEAVEVGTGETLWKYGYPTSYRDDFGFDEGPRAVPVVVDGYVYTFGAQGVLNAIDLETGEKIWSENTHLRFRVRKGFFGATSSPLVEDGRVLVNVGGVDAGIVAFNAQTGKVLWTSTGDEASYSSPVGATFSGRRYAVFFTRNGLVAVDPTTGKVFFKLDWKSRLRASVNGVTPLIIEDLIFLSATYGTGAVVLRVDGTELFKLWASDEVLSNHYATSAYFDGNLYGFHGRQEYTPSFRAIELKTGKVLWSEDGFRAGTVTLAGNRLVILKETGELVLAEASAAQFRPIARAQVLSAITRAYPALANGYLYARDEDILVCLDLRK